MSYAVVRTGGKQYRVSEGQVLRVEKLEGQIGDALQLAEVLLIGAENGATRVGAPTVAGASVSTQIVEQARGEKIVVFKKKRRKGYHKKQGHRQSFTGLKVLKISE